MIEKLPMEAYFTRSDNLSLNMLGELALKINELIDAVNRIEDGNRCPARCAKWQVRCDLPVKHRGVHEHGTREDGMIYWADSPYEP